MIINLHADGLCAPRNPGGHGAWGVVVNASEVAMHVVHFGYCGTRPGMTNNIAEYEAMTAASDIVKTLAATGEPMFRDAEYVCHGDAELVIKQITGKYACNNSGLSSYRDSIMDNVRGLRCRFTWVPREQNKEADFASRLGLVIGVSQEPDFITMENYDVQQLPGEPGITVHHLFLHGMFKAAVEEFAGEFECSCDYFRQHKQMGICRHIAALLLGHAYNIRLDVHGNKGYLR